MEGLCWRGWEKDISQCLNRNFRFFRRILLEFFGDSKGGLFRAILEEGLIGKQS